MIANIIYMIIAITCIEISGDVKITTSPIFAIIGFFLNILIYVTLVKVGSLFSMSQIVNSKDIKYNQDVYNKFSSIFAIIIILGLYIHLLLFNVTAIVFQNYNVHLMEFFKKIFGLFMFFLYLSIFWYLFSDVYGKAFEVEPKRKSIVKQNLRLYIPLALPYIIIVFLEQISSFLYVPKYFPSWFVLDSWVFSFLLAILLFLTLPPLVLRLWGCKRLTSEKINRLERFLLENKFSYKGIYTWPIFEGKMLTAGIIGPLPWMRYILVTEPLLDALSYEELKAVMAHEMGHAKLKHMWLYLMLLLLFSVFLWNIQEIINYLAFYLLSLFDPSLFIEGSRIMEILIILIYLLLVFCFLRYVFGYFMRNFERQADLFAAKLAGTKNIISALEKIAFFSGKAKDLPSWHHYSIAQRINAVQKMEENPFYYRAHNRKLVISFLALFLSFSILIAGSRLFQLKEFFLLELYEGVIENELKKDPDNTKLLLALAQISHEKNDEEKARVLYERILLKDPHNPTALNNLAWLILTKEKNELDVPRALELATKAVSIERHPAFLDTLAEAYFAKGDVEEALRYQREAVELSKGTKDEKAFREKLLGFQKALDTQAKPTQ